MGTGTINANGGTFDNTVLNDGSGGGGAGGSILIYANSGQSGITATAMAEMVLTIILLVQRNTTRSWWWWRWRCDFFKCCCLMLLLQWPVVLAGISHGTLLQIIFVRANGVVGVLTQTFPFSQLPPNMQICQSMVLPVTILSFSANYVAANNVKVSWTTTDEVNACLFCCGKKFKRIRFYRSGTGECQ